MSNKMEKQKLRLEENYERPFKSKNFFDAMGNAFRGIFYTVRTQLNIKIQLVFAIVVIIAAIVLHADLTEILAIVISIFLVLFAEMVNTAIETTIDLITLEYNIKAKIAKDIMAGAVLIISISSVIVGCIIFIPKILNLL